jgi:hypothetical protein
VRRRQWWPGGHGGSVRPADVHLGRMQRVDVVDGAGDMRQYRRGAAGVVLRCVRRGHDQTAWPIATPRTALPGPATATFAAGKGPAALTDQAHPVGQVTRWGADRRDRNDEQSPDRGSRFGMCASWSEVMSSRSRPT